VLEWLLTGGLGPALVALPVEWAGQTGARIAQFWFRRLRRADDLSRLVNAASAAGRIDLSREQFVAVRELLQDEHTWRIAGQGTVEDLIGLIAESLHARATEPRQESRTAAACIARGLLEFGVADIDPRLFQRLLVARLHRMEAKQATVIDDAMLSLHGDLAVWFASAQEMDERQSAEVMRQLRQILDLMPPRPAGRGELAIYLSTLIDWLSMDPWPRDQRFSGSVLNAAGLECSMSLRAIKPTSSAAFPADDLARSDRVVVLGGPGSGKTWLAKRTARLCAANALHALVAGDSLDDIELPLYITCSRLFSARGDIRGAVVSSAVDELADMGGSRLNAAIRAFFEERNAPTLLVIDSLDEASGPDERLLQADTLPWRIFLTSRPSSWNQQLTVNPDSGGLVAELQPLHYPQQVEDFITRWFASDPDRGVKLAEQIARRPTIQQAATLPLILTFYCLVSGDQQLPQFRRELYDRVLKRILTGRWRGRGPHPDVEACLAALRSWAWAASLSDPNSGIGTWEDDIPTRQQALGAIDSEAVGHVAVSIGLPDLDSGSIVRRFAHRSLREHLVASHLAGMPVRQAAGALIPHLWHDPDWEQVTPSAVTMHPQRDDLLRELLLRAARSQGLPTDLSAIDGGWQIRQLLARIACESHVGDWQPDLADLIDRARTDLASVGRLDDLEFAANWESSNHRIRERLLQQVLGNAEDYEIPKLVKALTRLDPPQSEMRQVVHELMRRLASGGSRSLLESLPKLDLESDDRCDMRRQLLSWAAEDHPHWTWKDAADAVLALDPTTEDKSRLRRILLEEIARSPFRTRGVQIGGDWAPIMAQSLAQTSEDLHQVRRELLGCMLTEHHARVAAWQARVLAYLEPTDADLRRARAALAGLIEVCTSDREVLTLAREFVFLNPVAEESVRPRRRLLAALDRLGGSESAEAAETLRALNPTDDEVRTALNILVAQLDPPEPSLGELCRLADQILEFRPSPPDRRRASESFIRGLVQSVSTQTPDTVAECEACLVSLCPDAAEKSHGIGELLHGLSQVSGDALVPYVVRDLAPIVIGLSCTADDRRRSRKVLLRLLETLRDSYCDPLLDTAVDLARNQAERSELRDTLLPLMRRTSDDQKASRIALAIHQLHPTGQDAAQLRAVILAAMARAADTQAASSMAEALASMAPTTADQIEATELLKTRMRAETTIWGLAQLADHLTQLHATPADKRHAREILLERMTARTTPNSEIDRITGSLLGLDAASEDKQRARNNLLSRLTAEADVRIVAKIAETLAILDPTPEENLYAMRILRSHAQNRPGDQYVLAASMLALHPTAEAITGWPFPQARLRVDLLAAARRNSSLTDWLAALASFAQHPRAQLGHTEASSS
jgi:NACHT domain